MGFCDFGLLHLLFLGGFVWLLGLFVDFGLLVGNEKSMCGRFFGPFVGCVINSSWFNFYKKIVVFCVRYSARHHVSFNTLRFRMTCYLCFSDHTCIKLIRN